MLSDLYAATLMAHNASTNLNIMAFNCQSIRHKVQEILSHMIEHKIHIAVFNETWLSDHHSLHFSGYTTYRTDRANGTHGGVALSIEDTLSHTQISLPITQVIETVGIKLQTHNNEESYIVSCYFPGSTNIVTISQFKSDIIILTAMAKKMLLSYRRPQR